MIQGLTAIEMDLRSGITLVFIDDAMSLCRFAKVEAIVPRGLDIVQSLLAYISAEVSSWTSRN